MATTDPSVDQPFRTGRTRREADFGTLAGAEGWEKVDAGAVAPWSDDYSDIIGAMLRKKLGYELCPPSEVWGR